MSTDTLPAVREKPRRRMAKLSPLAVLMELLFLAAITAAMFVVWFLWGDDFTQGREDDAAAAVVSEEWTAPTTDLGWLGGTDIPVTRTDGSEGATIGVMHIPRFGADYAREIKEGTDRHRILDQGVIGRYDFVQNVGEIGNFAVAGHRTTYGAPLNLVADMVTGDPIVVETELGWYVYDVADKKVVDPSEMQTIYPVPEGEPSDIATERWLTLTTCHPLYSAAERYIVWAKFDRFVPRGQTPPAELNGPLPDTIYVTTTHVTEGGEL